MKSIFPWYYLMNSESIFNSNYPIVWIKEAFVNRAGSIITSISTIICVKRHTTHIQIVFATLYVDLQPVKNKKMGMKGLIKLPYYIKGNLFKVLMIVLTWFY